MGWSDASEVLCSRAHLDTPTPVNAVVTSWSGLLVVVAISRRFILKLTIFWAGGNYLDMTPRTCTLVSPLVVRREIFRRDGSGSAVDFPGLRPSGTAEGGPSPHEFLQSQQEFRRTFLVTKAESDAGNKIAGTGPGRPDFLAVRFMEAGVSPARQARAKHRHELRTLTYVTLDQANGGIVRNLSHEGIGVQVVAAVRPRQQMRVRFELRYPRVRVEARGEVTWATFSGQCGIRFIDLSPRITRQINEWIFGNLLEGVSLHAEQAGPMFADSASAQVGDDGLMVSASPLKVIELPSRADASSHADPRGDTGEIALPATELDWLSRPLSRRSLIWTINTLVIVAALLLFALVFLSVTGEPPRWPLAMAGGAAILVAALYGGFFQLFGGISPGARLARLVGRDVEDEEARDARFR